MPTQSQISLSPISAKGDIISFDGSSRIRVAVGTNGQIITASSTDTSGIKWATPVSVTSGAFELIASTTLTADGTISFTGLSVYTGTTSATSRYAALHLFGYCRAITTSSESQLISGKFNGDGNSIYNYQQFNFDSTATVGQTTGQGPGAFYMTSINSDASSASYFTPIEMVVTGQMAHSPVASSNFGTAFLCRGTLQYTNVSRSNSRVVGGLWASSNTLNQIELFATNAGGSFKSGSSFSLYGYKRAGV